MSLEFSDEEGNRIFDLIFYNKNDNSLILVECKSQIRGKPKKDLFKQLSAQISNLYEKLSYLEKQIQAKLDQDKIEFVVLTLPEYADKVIKGLKDQETQPPQKRTIKEPSKVKVWRYLPTTGKIQLDIEHKHDNKVLTEELSSGVFVNTPTNEKFHLPINKESHNYRIIEYVLVRNIYKKKLIRDDRDKKVFSFSEFASELNRRLVLGVDEATKRTLVERKTKEIIKHGIKYGIFEPDEKKPDNFKIVCKGKRIETLKDNLYEKYQEKWASQKAEKSAKVQAIEDYKKKGPKLEKWFQKQE